MCEVTSCSSYSSAGSEYRSIWAVLELICGLDDRYPLIDWFQSVVVHSCPYIGSWPLFTVSFLHPCPRWHTLSRQFTVCMSSFTSVATVHCSIVVWHQQRPRHDVKSCGPSLSLFCFCCCAYHPDITVLADWASYLLTPSYLPPCCAFTTGNPPGFCLGWTTLNLARLRLRSRFRRSLQRRSTLFTLVTAAKPKLRQQLCGHRKREGGGCLQNSSVQRGLVPAEARSRYLRIRDTTRSLSVDRLLIVDWALKICLCICRGTGLATSW